MRKFSWLAAVFATLFFVPLMLQAQNIGPVRPALDGSGNVMIICRATPAPTDKWIHGALRDTSGNIVVNCGATPGPAPTPTPTPPAAAVSDYVATYGYYGSIAGQGSNDCAGVLCTSTANIQHLFWGIEGQLNGSTFDVSTTCGNGATCYPFVYQDPIDLNCNDSSEIGALYTDLNGSSETSFAHTATPISSANRQTASGTCVGSVRYQIWQDNTTFQTDWNTEWFAKSTLVNSRTWIGTRYDNWTEGSSGYTSPAACAIEVPCSASGEVTFRTKEANVMNAFHSYLTGANALGPGGGGYPANNTFDASHINNTPVNFASDVANICTNLDTTAIHNLRLLAFERAITNASIGQYMTVNFGVAANTASLVWADCPYTNIADLEQPYQGTSDSRIFRDMSLAFRMLLEPTNFNGNKTSQQIMPWHYNDCNGGGTACVDQVPIYPEDGLVFVPSTALNPWAYAGATAADGCHGGSGGAQNLVVSCSPLVYGRNGTCYKFGTSIGSCTVLFNATTSPVAVTSTWCTPACNTYSHVWDYGGTGPENLIDDTGAVICPSAQTDACNGTWGEATTFNGTALPGTVTIPAATAPGTAATSDPIVIFLSN